LTVYKGFLDISAFLFLFDKLLTVLGVNLVFHFKNSLVDFINFTLLLFDGFIHTLQFIDQCLLVELSRCLLLDQMFDLLKLDSDLLLLTLVMIQELRQTVLLPSQFSLITDHDLEVFFLSEFF
jgi:hypothetical protein